MQNEKEEMPHNVGEMKKDRQVMEDGRRYLIFYTFEKPAENDPESEDDTDV